MIPKLEVSGVSCSYHPLDGETLTLSNISFDASVGELIAIVSPFGCGKSTLLSMLSGLTQPEKGTIRTDDVPLSESRPVIGYMLQKDHLFEWRNIFSNISLSLEIQKRLDEPTRPELLETVVAYGLAGFEYAKSSKLPGGMRRRAALIQTLALRPDILLLDEPFSTLDYQTRLSVCDDTGSIAHKIHKTAILVTHDLSEAISMVDCIVVLSPRPGRVKTTLPVESPDGCVRPLDRHNYLGFSSYFNTV